MILQLYKQISDTKKFIIDKSNLLYLLRSDTGGTHSILEIMNFEANSLYKQSIPGLYEIETVEGGSLILSTNLPDATFILEQDTLKKLGYVLHLPGYKLDGRLYCLAEFKASLGFIEVSLIDLEVLRFWPAQERKNGIYLPLSFELFLSKKGDILSCHNLESNAELWRVGLQELLPGKEVNLYGRVVTKNGRLFFFLSDQRDERNLAVVCVDQFNGRLIERWKGLNGNLFLFGEQIGIAANYSASVVSCKTLSVISYNFEEHLKKEGLQIHWEKSVFTPEGLLYFVDGHFQTTNRFGIIDLKERMLIWHGALENKGGQSNAIQNLYVYGDKVYLQDAGNVLHIYNKI